MKQLLESLESNRLEVWKAMLRAYPGDARQRKEREYDFACSLWKQALNFAATEALTAMRLMVYGDPRRRTDELLMNMNANIPSRAVFEEVQERLRCAKWYLGYTNPNYNPMQVEASNWETVSILTNAMAFTEDDQVNIRCDMAHTKIGA